MVTTVTLSRGAMRMAARKVIVKRLAAIHDLGAMTVLCTDKTGTLTSAEIALARSLDPEAPAGRAAGAGLRRSRPTSAATAARSMPRLAHAASGRRAGLGPRRPAGVRLRAPLRFGARATGRRGALLILKGAPEAVLALCTARRAGGRIEPMGPEGRGRGPAGRSGPWPSRACAASRSPRAPGPVRRARPGSRTRSTSSSRASAPLPTRPRPRPPPPSPGSPRAGVRLKILSGDDPVVVRRLAGLVGLHAGTVLSGPEIAALSDAALAVRVRKVDAFGRLAPDQKARVVRALQASGRRRRLPRRRHQRRARPRTAPMSACRSRAPPGWRRRPPT